MGNNSIIGGGGFHHVAIKVKDYDRAVAFYTAIGFVEKLSWGGDADRGALLDSGDGNYIEIFAGGDGRPQPIWGEGAPLTHVCFRSNDIPGSIAAAERAGAIITMQPRHHTIDAHDGRKVTIHIAFCQTPTGEMVEFFDSAEL
jgi:glyoxylase I family protein